MQAPEDELTVAAAPGSAEESAITSAQSVLPRLRAAVPSLRPNDARVVQLILDQPEAAVYQSVSEIAASAETSTATVVRCAQTLGFKGFQDLKLALAQELPAFRGGLMAAAQESEQSSVLARVTAVYAQSVRDVAALVDPQAFDAAVATLSRARRVLVVGVGSSAPLVQDADYGFRTLGIASDAPADVHVQHVSARLLSSEDVCLAISRTGATRETLEIVGAAHAAGARTVAITSFLRSPLTDIVDIVLTSGSREASFRVEALATRLAHMTVIDALRFAIAELDQARAQVALELFGTTVAEHRF
jgi:RpiR family transcriptional regulator, carbohydrate utilization regulator